MPEPKPASLPGPSRCHHALRSRTSPQGLPECISHLQDLALCPIGPAHTPAQGGIHTASSIPPQYKPKNKAVILTLWQRDVVCVAPTLQGMGDSFGHGLFDPQGNPG